ncbi:MAG TPA: hypothetical protein VEP90_08245, partial [Methylomirabilota bacterium]|nr:hypothetical protein [Methylomirabilota bacterium]
PMLRTEVSSYVGLSSPLSFVSFIDEIWPAMKPYWSRYHEWLIATAKDIAFRWRCKIPSEVSEARDLLQQAIELACKENVVKGLHLADDWFRNI